MTKKADPQIWESESLRYAERNKRVEGTFNGNTLNIVKLLQAYYQVPESVLEIGCSYGYNLEAIHQKMGVKNLTGIEPSAELVTQAADTFPHIQFTQAFAHELPFRNEAFDLVIISGVFSWCFRDLYLHSLAEALRVAKKDILFVDFAPEQSYSTPYGHLQDAGLRTWKHDDAKIFQSLPFVRVHHQFFTKMGDNVLYEVRNEELSDWDAWRYLIVEKLPFLEAYPHKTAETFAD